MKTHLRLPSVEKTDLVKGQSYLIFVCLGGHKYFTDAIYKGVGRLAQGEGPDVDIEYVEMVFLPPGEVHIRKST